LAVLGFAGALLAQDLNLSVYVTNTSIGLNEQFALNIELSGADANDVRQPAAPNLSTFATYVGSSSSSNIQIVNGQMSVTKTYTYHYIANKAGKFIIPAVTVTYKNKKLAAEPIQVVVTARTGGRQSTGRRQTQQRPPDEADDISGLLYLRATVNKKRVYQNEPVIVTYKIYTAVNVTNYGVSQLPNTVGFWSEEFPQPSRLRLTNEVINGRQYRVAEIKRFALFPQSPGKKTLDAMVVECDVQLPRRRTRRDLFDSFFNDSFFSRTVRRTIASNVIEIDVQPLPAEAKPQDFSGLVGAFSIRASADKQKVKTNEAVTLKVTVSGRGNVRIIPEPKIDFPADFEVYDPKVRETINRKNNTVSGAKTFEYVLIPRFPGKQRIKPITLSYFDLASRKYKQVKTPAISIDVAKGADQFAGMSSVNSKEDVRFIGQDIRFIQMRLPEFRRMGPAFYASGLFYAVFIIPLLAFIGAVGYRKHLDKMSSNVAYARSRKANQMALRRLKAASKQMAAGNASEFYGEVSKALLGYLGDKLNRAPAGLILEEVEKELLAKGVQADSVHAYMDCINACDFNRFAPSQSEAEKMTDFFERAKQVIIELDKQL